MLYLFTTNKDMWRALLADYVEKRFTPCLQLCSRLAGCGHWFGGSIISQIGTDHHQGVQGIKGQRRRESRIFLCFAWSIWLCSLTHYCFFFHFAFVSAFSANFLLIDDTHQAISSFVMHYSMTKLFVLHAIVKTQLDLLPSNGKCSAWMRLITNEKVCKKNPRRV
jgi:hypothetical protein